MIPSSFASTLLCRSRTALGCLVAAVSLGANLHADALAPLAMQPRYGGGAGGGGSGGFSLLSWPSTPGFVYRVQKSTDLGNNQNWLFGDARVAESNRTSVELPQTSATEFYRLVAMPEIFSVEPMWVNSADPDAALYILGQCLPTNATVVINGQNLVPNIVNNGGVWASVSLNTLTPGELTGSLDVVDNNSGTVVATYKLQSGFIYATAPGASPRLAPPGNPPASPTPSFGKKLYVGNLPFTGDDNTARWQAQGIGHAVVVKSVEQARRVVDTAVGEVCDDGGNDDGDGVARMKAKEKANKTKCGNNLRVMPGNGELEVEATDLFIAGRGLDFAWTRTYRSRTGTDTAQGHGWDFSYNVSLTPRPDGTVLICMGNGRCETFYPNGTNGWARDEYFMQVTDLDSDGMPDVLFADSGKWLFRPVDAADPAGGKLSSIVDRNGNTISLNYSPSGHLSSIIDSLGRTITVDVDVATGRINSITDFTGRTVRYEYDTNGDLVACVSPAVVGTPNGNDFPEGKTNRYSYTSGFVDERLNHNLVSCIDGKGEVTLRINYQPTTDASSIDFDAVASTQRGIDKKDIRRGMVKPTPGNRFAVTQVIVNDYVGNVTEYLFDSRHRCVSQRDYTGRANPRLPTTAAENRPTGKLRNTDPDYYETLWTWNTDSLCTSETLPGGNRTIFVYQGDLDPAANPRHKGNLRVLRQLACCADADSDGDGTADFNERAWRFEYDPRFGSDPLALDGIVPSVSGHAINTKGTGASGRIVPTSTQHAINTKGTGAAGRISPPQTGMAINTKGTGAAGRLAPPQNGLAIKTKGTSAQRVIVRDIKKGGAAREKEKPFLMPVDDVCMPVGFAISEIDPLGNMATAGYDANGNCSVVNPKAARDNHLQGAVDVIYALRFGYNSHGQLTAITNAADADGYHRVDTFTYYTNGVAVGMTQSAQRDANGNRCTYEFQYDARGNVTRLVDPLTNDWLFAYNELDQCVRCETPVNISARCATDFFYDENDNLVRCSEQVRDETDKEGGTLSTLFDYDSLQRCTAVAEQVSSSQFVTNRFFYNAEDALISAYSPLAVAGVDPLNGVAFEYDERGLLYRVIYSPASTNQTVDQFDYTLNGRIGTMNGGIESPGRVTSYEYDGFERCVRVTDPMGNDLHCAYDRCDNLIRARIDAEKRDLPASTVNLRYHEWTWTYDPRGRCVQETTAFFDPETQTPIGTGSSSSSFSYAPNGQLVSESDPRRNVTLYSYDTVGRVASVTDAKTNVVSYTYDNAGNVTRTTSLERSDVSGLAQEFYVLRAYNKLHRLLRSVDNVGNTNEYSYDSRGNLVRQVDPNGVLTAAEYDGLGRKLKLYVDQNGDGTLSPGDTLRTFAWDDNDRLISMTDANTNTTSYVYDSRDRCVSVTEADGTACSLVWSPRSNLTLRQDANGTVVSNSFDLLDRCIRRDVTPGAGVATSTTFEEFAYDGLGRVVMASNDVSRVDFSYDSLGNTTRSSHGGFDVVLIYDQNGNCTQVTYPNGGSVSYSYDALDQVSTISGSPLAGMPSGSLASFAYDGPGRVSRVARGNGVNTRITWNGLVSPPNAPGDFGSGSVSSINHQVANGGAVIDRRAFSYDRNQNKILRRQVAPFVPGGELTTNVFEYDGLNRVSMAIKSKGTGAQRIAYELDGGGNRKTVTVTEDVVQYIQSYAMDATLPNPGDFQVNQYTVTPFGGQQYDASGNMIWRDDGDLAFVYDYANRLVGVQQLTTGSPETLVTFAYDALGRRISKTTYPPAPLAPVTSEYIYDPPPRDCDDGDSLIEERVGGNVFQVFCWGGSKRCIGDVDRDGFPDLVAAVSGAGELRYYHGDELGNVLALTDAGGSVIERYDYDDYGTPDFLNSDGFPLTGSDGLPVNFSPAGNPFLFNGMFWDEEISCFYEGWPERPWTYSPATGRYLMRAGVPLRGDARTSFRANNPWTLKKEEGGRHTPFHNKKASYGGMTGIGHPRYAVREGGRTIGAGTVSDIIERTAPRNPLRGYFEAGDVPTQEGFRKILDYGEAGDNIDSRFLEVQVGGVVLSPRLR